jgi:glycerol uptake facilitator-like aquaporin
LGLVFGLVIAAIGPWTGGLINPAMFGPFVVKAISGGGIGSLTAVIAYVLGPFLGAATAVGLSKK